MQEHRQLNSFQNNSGQRDAVKAFMINVLEDMAVEKAFAGESVLGFPEARKLVDKTFEKLDELYGKVEEPIISNSR